MGCEICAERRLVKCSKDVLDALKWSEEAIKDERSRFARVTHHAYLLYTTSDVKGQGGTRYPSQDCSPTPWLLPTLGRSSAALRTRFTGAIC